MYGFIALSERSGSAAVPMARVFHKICNRAELSELFDILKLNHDMKPFK
jgi:hypothetical protein